MTGRGAFPARRAAVSIAVFALALLAVTQAAGAESPAADVTDIGPSVTYVIDIDDIFSDFGSGQLSGLVRTGDMKQVIMEDPVLVIGSGVDDYERKGIERTLVHNYFRSSYILDDTSREFMGKPLTDYDLILIGGPGHNAYTKYLVEAGALDCKTTDQRMPAVIVDVEGVTPGRNVIVVGDAAGFDYHARDLPVDGIIPGEYVPVAAVAAGAGVGILGLFLGRIGDLFAMLLNKLMAAVNAVLPLDTVSSFLEGYVKTHVKNWLQRKESRVRKVQAREGASILAGFTSRELAVMAVSAVLLGFAYMVAKDVNLLRMDMIFTYVLVAGVATVMHDMTHRFVAWKYHAVSEYRFWGIGTIAMYATSWLFGLVYALPARTIINGADKLTKRQQAIVYLAGPSVSLVLALVFLLLMLGGGTFRTIGLIGCSMNILSAAYSLMPFDPMDGNKVYKWKWYMWGLVFLPLIAFYLMLAVYVI